MSLDILTWLIISAAILVGHLIVLKILAGPSRPQPAPAETQQPIQQPIQPPTPLPQL